MSSDTKFDYDFIVIGGGSGGLACAKRAVTYGATAAIIEAGRWGGTCVNVGCVPKKVMFNASHVNEVLHEAKEFGFSVSDVSFNWSKLKAYRDRYISRLNGIYVSGLDKLNVTHIDGFASFIDPQTIKVVGADKEKETILRGKHILIAVGGAPNGLGVPGEELAIDSDGFFLLETQPKKAAVIGAGYIAVELAGVFNGLGTDTSLFVRGDKALRNFDAMLSTQLDANMKKAGIKINTESIIKELVKEADGTVTVHLESGLSFSGFDCVLSAIGRHPLVEALNLSSANVALTSDSDSGSTGYIQVDDYQNTTQPGVYALGDVCGKIELTPMAIAAGRRLADRLFGNQPNAKADYTNVPTVVFSHPVIGTCGLTEQEAEKEYGQENLKIYTSGFVNLWYGPYFEGGPGDKPISKYKLICEGPTQRVVGLHMIGMGSDEVLQGFGVAMKMGATKLDFDNCVAIHPTAAEEMVTLPPWGLLG